MSLFRINKKIALVLLLILGVSSLNASTCDRRAFNIAVTDTVTIIEI